MNWKYRVWQFWNALIAKPNTDDFAIVGRILPTELRDLFFRMSKDEQAHSIRVCKKLIAEGENEIDLLAAALLHDVGKTFYPLKLWERIWIVFWRERNKDKKSVDLRVRWDEINQHPWWRRAMIVAENHAEWGAEILRQYHANPRLVWLVRYHQEYPQDWNNIKEFTLLEKLRRVDNIS
ncbi:MAG: HD domain-containing protein [Anaerolineales bacterium]